MSIRDTENMGVSCAKASRTPVELDRIFCGGFIAQLATEKLFLLKI